MRYFSKVLIALVATAMLAVFVESASANRLSVTNTRFRATWTSLEPIAEGVGLRILCPATLEGSFHSATIRKVPKALIGAVTSVRIRRPCTGGRLWFHNGSEVNEVLGNTVFPNTLPWHLTYDGFEGVLPNITRVNVLLQRARFTVRPALLGEPLCQYSTSPTNGNLIGRIAIGAGGQATSITATGEIASETIFCPTKTFRGDGQVFLQGNTSRISVTLI